MGRLSLIILDKPSLFARLVALRPGVGMAAARDITHWPVPVTQAIAQQKIVI